jgi:uncharacterized protein
MASRSGGKEEGGRSASRPLSTEEKRTAMWCHLSSLAGLIIPGASILAPLFCWLSKKDSSRFVNFHGKESLNFQINMLLYSIISCPFCCAGGLCFLLFSDRSPASFTAIGGGIVLTFVFVGAIALFEIVVSIFAGVKANEGDWYRYPYVLFRFFK